MDSIRLRRGEERRILRGHAWVFSNEIAGSEGPPAPGDVVAVQRWNGRLLGYGIYNPSSLIAVRLFSKQTASLDEELFSRRIRRAAELRERLYPGSVDHRLVHGESDGLPGLIVDRYGDAFVLQTLALGMDRAKDRICDALENLFHPRTIIERNESPLRALEGLPRASGVLRGERPEPVRILEGDLTFEVDLLEGHKTGFYFDQRENRLALRRLAPRARVLDAYCHDGPFAVHLAAAGAREVTGLDASPAAIRRAGRNAALNGVEGTCHFQIAELPGALGRLRGEGRSFDMVVLDPPSFTRTRKGVAGARRAYVDLNRAALRLLPAGGILASSSCSHHVTDETFLGCLREAAVSLGRRARILEWRSQSPDHPVHPAMPETRYLKFAILHVEGP